MGLKEILKVSDDGATLGVWHTQAISGLESFLVDIKVTLQQQQLSLLPIAISYSNDAQSASIQKTAELLSYIFTQMGMPTTLCPLEDAAKLNAQLDGAGYAVVLCTPEYAAKVGKGSAVWNVLDAFGKKKKNALHPLLCEGEFKDVALQIVDGHYLIRSIHAVLNEDPLIAVPALIDITFHLSGSQGLGLLPDVLNLKETVNAKAEVDYKKSFHELQISIQKHTVDYRLKTSLEESVQHHSLKTHNERPKIDEMVERFLQLDAKVGLFFCQNKADTLLTSLHLAEILNQKTARVLSIDCGKYPGQASWDCVQKALKALKLKSADIETMKQEPLIIILNGYQDLGAYDNLWVKNALSTWTNVKLLVTCQADYFKERGYLRCFLADVSNRRVEDIAVYPVPTFASLEAQMAALSITVVPDANQDVEQCPISDKHKAEYVELTRFLERLNQIWVAKDYLKSALHQNPKLFISYAWEADKIALARQQMYLSRMAQDFKTIGIPTWLDTEQMSGNIDEQMEKNIAESDGVLVIETPRYIERAQQATNVKKEWDAICSKSQQQAEFRIFPIQYSFPTTPGNQALAITSFLANHANRCNFTQIDEDYVARMTHPESGLITRWLCDTPEKKYLYQDAYASFQQDLQLLVGKHLIVNEGQSNVLAFDMNNRLKGYIAPFGLTTEDSPMDSRFDLVKYFEEFLNKPECKTSIVLGIAGSGKSLFALSTFKQLLQPWITYQNTHQEKPKWLPIYIQLRNYAQQPEHAIQNALKQQFRLSDADIMALKQGLNHQQPVLFILDGYDELGSGIRPNYTETLKDWPHAKLLITSRPEHFDKENTPLYILRLTSTEGIPLFSTIQLVYVSHFSVNEMQRFVEERNVGQIKEIFNTLKSLSGMMELLGNPFLLTLVLQSLPQLLKNSNKDKDRAITRTDIYQAFIETWFLQETKGRELGIKDCEIFCQSLAFRFFAARTTTISQISEKKDIWAFFSSNINQAVQDASPLRLNSGEYSFIHKSIYEYFVAKRLWRSIDEPDCLKLWQNRILIEERNIVYFLAELYKVSRVNSNEMNLLKLVKGSRNRNWVIASCNSLIASSNAITVLNAARISFSGQDLRDIQIPMADLTGAICDNTNFENADLTNVIFSGAWLNGACFKNALMAGVEFGEYTSLLLEENANSFCYSPNGRTLAVAQNNSIYLYDASSKRIIRRIKDQTNAVSKMLIDSLKGHKGKTNTITSIAFSPNGHWLASGRSIDNTIKLWSVDNGELQKTLEAHSVSDFKNVSCIGFSPDGKLLASGENLELKGMVNLWFLESGLLQNQLIGVWPIRSIEFSPDGKQLAFADGNGVAISSVESGLLLKRLDGAVISIHFSPDGKLLAFGDNCDLVRGIDKNTVKLWSLESGTVLKTLEGQMGSIRSVRFSPNGKFLASGSSDGTVNLWIVKNGSVFKTLEGHTGGVFDVFFSPNENLLVSNGGAILKFWSIKGPVLEKPSEHIDHCTNIHISPNGKLIASVIEYKNIVKLWSVDNGVLLKTFEGHTSSILCVAFSLDGKFLASGCSNGKIELWIVESGSLHKTLEGHTEGVTFVHHIFDRDKKYLVSGSDDKTVKFWSIETGKLLSTTNCSDSITSGSMAFHCLALGCYDKTVNLMFVAGGNGAILKALESHTGKVTCVHFRSDGKFLASGSIDKTVKLWSMENRGTLIKTLHESDEVTCVQFSPTGNLLASGSRNTLNLWNYNDLETESACYVTYMATDINLLLFQKNQNGTYLVTAHIDCVRYWQLIEKNKKPYLQLLWSSHQNSLLAQNANITGVQGLSLNNADLLTQRGAIGKPLMLSDEGKIASGSNNSSSSSSQNNNNAQHKNEIPSAATQGSGEGANYGGQQNDKKDCKIM